LVDALLVVVCHGGWVRVDEMHRMTAGTRNGLALYAMADLDSIILATPDESGEQWSISDIGLLSFSRRCGDGHPERLTGGNDTRYLLPPL
jgi:hypothetical protein